MVTFLAGITTTLGGLRIDDRAQAAPGIFACGNDAGGVATTDPKWSRSDRAVCVEIPGMAESIASGTSSRAAVGVWSWIGRIARPRIV